MISPTHFLLAQKNTLEKFLKEIPEEEVLERESLLARLDDVEEELAKTTVVRGPSRATITYKGKPVVGSHGIASNFGLSATRAYTRFVQLVAVQLGRVEPLGTRGRVRRAQANDLLITGPAYGSFGFELEEQLEADQTIFEKTEMATALEVSQALLHGTVQSDDDLAQVVAGVDPRAIASLRSFLKLLVANDAVCTIQTEENHFHFDDVNDVRYSLARLDAKNIHYSFETLRGEFVGAMPSLHTFEFEVEGTNERIIGKLDQSIKDEDPIIPNVRKQVEISVQSHRVGNGKPYYVLLALPDWDQLPRTRVSGELHLEQHN